MAKKLIEDYPEIAAEWHREKNDADVNVILFKSQEICWWICPKCGHEYRMRLYDRTHRKSGCPCCRSHRKTECLAVTHPHLIAEWHPTKNGDKDPRTLTAGHTKHAWWLGKCGHEWQATVRNRAKAKTPNNCPYCAGVAVWSGNTLSTMFPSVAEEWHPSKNGDVTPDKVHFGTWKKYWWMGKCGHEWFTSVHVRTRKRPGGCPYCWISKGELKVEECLIILGLEYKKEVRFESCRNERPLVFDFQVGNVLIEYQGIQHYEPKCFGINVTGFITLQKCDQIKRDWCRNNGFKLLEISYTQYDSVLEVIKREVNCGP